MKSAAADLAKGAAFGARMFNPANSIKIHSLNDQYLIRLRNDIVTFMQNDEVVENYLGKGNAHWLRTLQANPTAPVIEEELPLLLNMQLAIIQTLYGKSSLFPALVDRILKSLNHDFTLNLDGKTKRIMFSMLAFFKQNNQEYFLKLNQAWPHNLEKIAYYEGDFNEYFRLFNRIKLSSDRKLLFSYSLVNSYMLPLIFLNDSNKPVPLFLKDSKNEKSLEVQLLSFLQLILAKKHCEPNIGWVCEYNSSIDNHIRMLAADLNKKLGFVY